MSTPKAKPVPSPNQKPKKILKYKALYEALLTKHTALMSEVLNLYRELRVREEEQTIQVEQAADQTGDVLAKLAALAKAQQKPKATT